MVQKVICDMLLDRHRVALSLADSRPVYGYYMVCMKLIYMIHTCYMQIPINMHKKKDRQALEHSYQYVLVEITLTVHSSSPTSVLYLFVVQ